MTKVTILRGDDSYLNIQFLEKKKKKVFVRVHPLNRSYEEEITVLQGDNSV